MMATTEERMKILRMIQEGKITAEEGAKLLSALRETRKPGARAYPPSPAQGSGRGLLRVRVTDTITGKTKVNVNLPLGLMEAALRIGGQYAPELNGLDVGMIIEEIRAGTLGKIVDVEDVEDGEHVEIFVE